MNGLKRVRARYDDALTQVDWQQLEVLLAVYYRGQGYAVQHVGTGATGARSDGGIDLKLRRDDEYVLVQVKHWNACQVPHNDVHQLLGIMVNEGATGAILITSGEFTKAAIEAATRQGHVQLIDGAELRALLGPLPGAPGEPRTPMVVRGSAGRTNGDARAIPRRGDPYGTADTFMRVAGERLLDAAEDRIRYGGHARSRARSVAATGLSLLLLKLAVAAVMFGVLWVAIAFAMNSLRSALAPRPNVPPAAVIAPGLPAPTGTPRRMPAAAEGAPMPAGDFTPPREPTAAEIRESQRKADEAMRVIEATTPEM